MPATPRSLRRLLDDGAPTVLPRLLDGMAEWWAARRPRERQALGLFVAALLATGLLAGGSGGDVALLVAHDDLRAGHVLGPGDLVEATWPARLRPPGAVTGPAAALVGQALSAPLGHGVPLTDTNLAPADPANLAPDGYVALALEADLLPDVPAGTVLDLHGGDGSSVTAAVALGVRDGVAWLGVAREQAGILSQALAWGPVRVAVVPTRPGPTT